MSTMNEVLNDAKTLAKSYRAVLSLMAKLEEIGDLDKAYEAAEKRLREHKQEVATAANKAKEANDRLEVVYDEVAKAKEKATEIIFIANSEAKFMLANTSVEVADMNKQIKAETEKATKEVDNFHKHVRVENENHKARMTQNDTDYAEAAERLAVLNTELAALRERIA